MAKALNGSGMPPRVGVDSRGHFVRRPAGAPFATWEAVARSAMRTWSTDVGVVVRPGDGVELRVVDLSLARAFFAGIPAARLLARMRLASDERDLAASPLRKSATSSWDALLARLLADSPAASERVKRAIAKHARAAFDE